MKKVRLLSVALLAWVAMVVISCADPTNPAPRSFGVTGDLVTSDLAGGAFGQLAGLLQCTPLPYDSVTQTIGPEGGTIQVGPHAFTVPGGALDSTVRITAVTPPDTINRVRFQPEGLVFNGYVTLRMSYANCNLLGSLTPKRIAYVSSRLEILDYLPSNDNALTQTVRGKVQHFSEYAVAW